MSKVPRSARPAARADEDEAFFASSKKITVMQSKCKTKRTTTVNMGAAAGTSSRTRGKETGKQVDTSPSCGGLRDSDRLRAGAAFLALSVVVVAMTWYWDAEEGDGADETLRRTWGTRLPRISYMGANLPAYFVFATLVPIGCLIVRAPLIRAIDRVVAFAGTCLPAAAVEHMQCSCTCCCCCCCGCAGCDADMTAGDRAIREQLAAGASMLATTVATQQPGSEEGDEEAGRPSAPAPGCCCHGCGYLPYLLAALRPLSEATLGGLALLAIVSVSFGPWGVFVHFLGAMGFFYGSMALHFCYILSIRQLISLYPARCTAAGFSSRRLYPHSYVLAAKMFVTFFNEWFIFFLGRVIETSGGTDKLTNFSYHYLAALDQWFIVSCTLMVALLVAADVDALDAALAAANTSTSAGVGEGEMGVSKKTGADGLGNGTEMSVTGSNLPPAETALVVGTADAGAETRI